MNRATRLVVFALGGGSLAVLFVFALRHLPTFGGTVHPYRDMAVRAALAQHTPNAVSSVNFDQRGLDTFGEETILFMSVLGAATLLRPGKDERATRPPDAGRMLWATRLGGYVLLPVTLIIGADALALTDIVVSATVTALLLALVIQVAKRHGTVVPDELHALRG